MSELTSRLEASCSAITDLSGALSAKQLAVEAEEAAVERRRRELATADVLIQRLMNAVAQTQGHGQAGHSGSSACASTASSGSASGVTVDGTRAHGSGSNPSSPAHSPQSSIGSVSLCKWGRHPAAQW